MFPRILPYILRLSSERISVLESGYWFWFVYIWNLMYKKNLSLFYSFKMSRNWTKSLESQTVQIRICLHFMHISSLNMYTNWNCFDFKNIYIFYQNVWIYQPKSHLLHTKLMLPYNNNNNNITNTHCIPIILRDNEQSPVICWKR